LKKKFLGLTFTSLFILGISFGTYNIATHVNMNKWKQEKLVITVVQTSQKAVTLTFDDGPDPERTPAVLDSLRKHNVHATFFVVGNRAEKEPQLLQKMAEQGHEIANHSYSHNYSVFRSDKTEIFKEEIDKTSTLIEEITSQKPVLFRPPGGYLSNNLVNLIKHEQLTIAYWTWQQDSKDWKVGTSANTIANHIIKNIQPGQIILLHDGASNGLETAEAVDILLDKLIKEGYRFLTMSELIKLGNEE
jgi:peptidoglycan/xylan/chitin deacetylase (PgdA/CDA1 family)